MNKKIMTITTIAVLATSLMTIAMLDDAQAQLVPDTSDFKCDEVIGSFFSPPATAPLLFSSAWGDCTLVGQAGLTSILVMTGAGPSGTNCITLATPPNPASGPPTLESFAINEKGYISFNLFVEQCFFTDAALTIPASPLGSFCAGGPADPAFSTVSGSPLTVPASGYTITPGGNVDGKPVVGGSGSTFSVVNHCDPSAPFGNSGVSSFSGTIDTLV